MYVKKCDIELLESKLNVSELEKARLEDEIKVLKQKNVDLENSIGKIIKEEEEKFHELMIENSVLECEKKKAESEVEAWKEKCNEFETLILELQKQMQLEKVRNLEMDSANMNEVNNDKGPRMRTRHRNVGSEIGKHSGLESWDRNHIDVTTEGGQHRNVSPSAPGAKPSVDVVDISNSDDNLNLLKIRKRLVTNRVTSDSDDPVDISDSDHNLNHSKTKKKRVTSRVTSNSDDLVDPVDISDNDDDQNRSKIKKKRVTNRVTSDSDDPVDISDSKDKQNRSMIKKKRVTNRVTSDSESDDPVDIGVCEDNQNHSKIKKKRVANRVTSDNESDDPVETSVRGDNLNPSKTRKRKVNNGVICDSEDIDDSESGDDVPLSKLRSKNLPVRNVDTGLTISMNDSFDKNLKKSTRRRRLNKRGKKSSEISKFMNEVDVDDEKDEDGLETNSLNGFIVDDSVASEDHSASNSKDISENDRVSSCEPQNGSDEKDEDNVKTASLDEFIVETSVRGDNLYPSKTRKRKVKNRVICDSESDDDVPLSKLRSRNLPARNVDAELASSMNGSFDENPNKSTRRRRLTKRGKKSAEVYKFMNEVDDDEEKGEDDLETDSLKGFIVDGPDASEDHSGSDSKEISENDEVSSGEPKNESENSMDYPELMSRLRREKKQKGAWKYQTDMLAEFGKNNELCMEAICAMCRHHEENWEIKGEGFNKFDRDICYELALFMTNGHLDGEVKKTVKELEKGFKPGGAELESEGSGTELESEGFKETELESEGFSGTEMCRHYASKYSRQLFDIYKSEQDPYFHFDHLVSILNKNM